MTALPDAAGLAEHLSAAEDALERDDPLAAEQSIAAALRSAQSLAAAGVALDREDLARLTEQHARLTARAVEVRDALGAQLQAFDRSQRAAAAYRRR